MRENITLFRSSALRILQRKYLVLERDCHPYLVVNYIKISMLWVACSCESDRGLCLRTASTIENQGFRERFKYPIIRITFARILRVQSHSQLAWPRFHFLLQLRFNKMAPTAPPKTPASVFTLPHTPQLEALYTIIRDKNTPRGDFLFYSDRIIRLLVEEGLNHLPVIPKTVETPTGATYNGVGFEGKICGVSILRAGEAMEAGLREVCRSVRIGKILIQRDEETAQPKLFYAKLPPDIAQRYVLLLDPMLATGGSAMKAVEVIMGHGVPEDRIIFINLISSPEGLQTFSTRFPSLRVITGWIDEGLNEKAYIVPGLGDFGERRYCV